MKLFSISIYVSVLSFLLTGCKGIGEDVSFTETKGDFEQTSFGPDATAIRAAALQVLEAKCMSCHNDATNSVLKNWRGFETDADWQKAGLIVAGNVSESKLTKRMQFGPGTKDMPPLSSGFSFAQEDYDKVKSWVEIITPLDEKAPTLSQGSPSGVLARGTTQVVISVTTDEISSCRFSETAGTAYSSMIETLSSSSGLAHTANVSGLRDGNQKTYYIRCQDAFQNANTSDFSISFSIDADRTAPTLSSGSPMGTVLPAGTTSVQMSVSTNESSSCRYSASQQTYDQMSVTNALTTQNNTQHFVTLNNLDSGANYSYYIACIDDVLNSSNGTYRLYFSIAAADTTAPILTEGAPSGNLPLSTTQATLGVSTNENATCKYSTSANVSYASMTNTFGITGARAHSSSITGLTAGQTYNYYVRCQDISNNTNTSDYRITFTIANVSTDQTAAILSNGAPSGTLVATTTQATLSLVTNEAATCKYSTAANTTYSSMSNVFTTTGGTSHSRNVSGLTRGNTYNYYVRCIDAAQNVNTTDYRITFTVDQGDTVSPVLSGGTPSGSLATGTRQITLSLSTNEVATCRYSTTSSTAYASMAPMTNSNSTLHSTVISAGLSDGASYSYYIRCQDIAGNANTSSYTISFSILGDTTAPVLSAGLPTGAQSATTSSVTLSVSTNETSTCRYATSAGTAFSSMTNNMTANGTGRSHSANVTGLQSGQAYNYYLRCRDTAGNMTTQDYLISFSIDGSVRQNAMKAMNDFCYGCHADWSNYTDVQWQQNGLVTAQNMTTSKLNQRLKYGNGAQDMPAGMLNQFQQTDYNRIALWVNQMAAADVTPPVLSALGPTGTLTAGTTSTQLSVTTNENATCKFSTTANTAYALMSTTFSQTGARTHTHNISGLANGTNYRYYVRCSDTSNNVNPLDASISFNIDSPPMGLISHWKLDETSGSSISDSSGLNNTGTFSGGVVRAAGRVGTGAITLNGSTGYIDIANSPSLNISGNQVSILAWINFQSTNASQVIVSKPSSSSSNSSPFASYALRLNYSGGSHTPAFRLAIGGAVIDLASSTALTAGQWYLVGAVYNGSQMSLYINGTLSGTKAQTGSLNTYATAVRIGANGGMSEDFKGTLDDIRIYNTAITAGEISALYQNNETTPPVISNLKPSNALSNGTSSTVISVDTDEIASCKFSNVSGLSFSQMTGTMTANTAGLQHQATVSSLQSGQSYTYYVHCRDALGNTTTSATAIQFSITGGGDGFTCSTPDTLVASTLKRLAKTHYINSIKEVLNPLGTSTINTLFSTYPTAANTLKINDLFALIPDDSNPYYSKNDKRLFLNHAVRLYDIAFEIGSAITSNTAYANSLAAFPGSSGSCQTAASLSSNASCLSSFLDYYLKKSFRKLLNPLDPDDIQLKSDFTDFFKGQGIYAGKNTNGLGALMTRLLAHPRFFYQLDFEGNQVAGSEAVDATYQLSDYELLSKITYLFWSRPPNDELYALMLSPRALDLSIDADLSVIVNFVINHANARDGVRNFYYEWLELEKTPEIGSIPSQAITNLANASGIDLTYKNYKTDMINEVLDLTEYYTLASSNGRYDDLMNDKHSFARTPQLAKIYGLTTVWNGSSTLVNFPSGQPRSGILTRAAYTSSTSEYSNPIHKGKRIKTAILCNDIPPPPPTVNVVPIPFDPSKTTRTLVDNTTSGTTCNSCHSKFNPFGFATENFNPFGIHRTRETKFLQNGSISATMLDVNTQATVSLTSATSSSVADGVELASYIASSGVGQMCMVRNYFRYTLGREESETTDGCGLEQMRIDLTGSNGSLKKMMSEVVKRNAFRFRKVK